MVNRDFAMQSYGRDRGLFLDIYIHIALTPAATLEQLWIKENKLFWVCSLYNLLRL